ncbi:odorant receptor 46a-like [Daktulosphaira vitifoliae]|uniref:odorant receptor 46a-like n=1 Tax=Daktulosphaira vitifoliae TaxID=58002 RepID=UPI0021AA6D1F|nr:odorant receptor 46a-like [Daktulosphaira vitifoliae]
MMEINKYENWIFNIRLGKFLGYYYILNPKTEKSLNFFCFLMKFGIIYVAAISTFLLFGLYHWKNDITQFTLQLVVLQNLLFAIYRMCLIMKDSKIIWDILKISNLEFLTIENYNKNILNIWRDISIKFTYLIAILTFSLLLIWSSCGYVFNNSYIFVKNHDGTYSNYHLNVYNFFLGCLFEVISDIILISICLSITGQLEVINDSFENVGLYKENILRQSINVKEFQEKVKCDLKNIIYNTQNVIRKMEQFYNLFGRLILLQIVVISTSLILFSYTGMLHFINGGMVNSVQTVKVISPFLVFVIQLFILCFIFGIINDRKDSLVFGVYNSNWTEMNLESKKLVLLTMKMNNAHQSKMKITRYKTIDLTMFIAALKMCYSVFSVLRNTQLSNNQI